MRITTEGTKKVARRFRRAAWIFGLTSLTALIYAGAYQVAVLASIGFWGVFMLAAVGVERAGGADTKLS